jgi:two-component system LytT family response regulator
MLRSYRTVIVDAHAQSMLQIRELLNNDPDIYITGVCSSRTEALEWFAGQPADILIQRSELPDGSGFELMKELAPDSAPAVVFIADSEGDAEKAFDVRAADFVRNPLQPERFLTAVKRAKEVADWKNTGLLTAQLSNLLMQNGLQSKRYPNRLAVKTADRTQLITVSEIDFVEADGNYVALHAENKKHLMRETMTNMSERLDPEQFVRIHRSTIVNIDRIKELQPWFHGDFMVLLKNGKKLTMSRNFRKNLQRFLEQ